MNLATKFTTGNADINGTCLQGYVETTYARIVEVFGEPTSGGDKTTAEWDITFDDGTVATIYDWKEYSTPKGYYDWHIGGHSKWAVELVTNLIA